MSGRFDVLDSWGNKVGEFIPSDSGSGCLISIIVMLVMAILWTVGFLFYCVYWLAAKGVAAAKEGKWFEASVWWVIPAALVVGSMVLVVHLADEAAAKKHYQQVKQERAAEERYTIDLPDKLEIENTRRVRCGDTTYSCPEGDDQIYILFTVVNQSRIRFSLQTALNYPNSWERLGSIEAYQKKEFRLVDWSAKVASGEELITVKVAGGSELIPAVHNRRMVFQLYILFGCPVRDDFYLHRDIPEELSPQ